MEEEELGAAEAREVLGEQLEEAVGGEEVEGVERQGGELGVARFAGTQLFVSTFLCPTKKQLGYWRHRK